MGSPRGLIQSSYRPPQDQTREKLSHIIFYLLNNKRELGGLSALLALGQIAPNIKISKPSFVQLQIL